MSKYKSQLKPSKPDLFHRVVAILDRARDHVVRSVNSEMVVAYWLIGREIVLELQGGSERAKYGRRLLEDLSERLIVRYGEGYSLTNLKYFRTFYLVYQDKNPLIGHPMGDLSRSFQKGRPLGDQSGISKQFKILSTNFHPNLTWSHYRALMRVENKNAREFYEVEAERCNWGKRDLERQIATMYYERILASRNKADRLQDTFRSPRQTQPIDVLKDPYVLEFLNLPDSSKLHESQMEQAIIDNLQAFLLELGKGFAFVARQKRMRFDSKDFYVDLVFYNISLKCFVLIDLKIGELTHQDIGQMDGYVRMFEEHERTKEHNPTIGLILCSEKNEAIAKYSVLKENKQLFASKYKLYLPTENELRRELERERRLIETRNKLIGKNKKFV